MVDINDGESVYDHIASTQFTSDQITPDQDEWMILNEDVLGTSSSLRSILLLKSKTSKRFKFCPAFILSVHKRRCRWWDRIASTLRIAIMSTCQRHAEMWSYYPSFGNISISVQKKCRISRYCCITSRWITGN